MKTSKMMLLFGATVAVSGLTSFGTFKWMESAAMGQLTTDSSAVNLGDNVQHVGLFPTVSKGSVTDNDFTKAAEETVKGVVGVRNTQLVSDPITMFFGNGNGIRQQQGFGSGVIITADGYIVTNNHVVEGADQLTVTLNDGKEFPAELIGTDEDADIALLKIDATDLPVVPFGDSDALKVGQWVLAVGNPFQLTGTVTAGIISYTGRNVEMQDERDYRNKKIKTFIQTDAAVNPGNSGGALVNTAGELVGINTMITSQTGNYAGCSFAVPSSWVARIVSDLRQYGQVQRAVLGVAMQNEPENGGAKVAEVREDGAADKAGIKEGDVIVAIDKKQVKDFADVKGAISSHSPGDKIVVTVKRDDKEKDIDVTLLNAEGSTKVVQKKGVDALGATFQDLDKKQLAKYGVGEGVLVKKVQPGSAFARARVPENFLIVKVNNKAVSSAKDIEDIYEKLTKSRSADQEPVMFLVGVLLNGRVAYCAVDLNK